MRKFSLTTWACLVLLVSILGIALFGERALDLVFPSAEGEDDEYVEGADLVQRTLPPAPERALVEMYCQTCHHLTRTQKSGGTVEGWTSRLERMNTNGAMLPPEDIPRVARYLASALPVRARAGPP